MSVDLPSGVVTFLMTDIEGSTRMWAEAPDAMRAALARHDAIAADVVAQHAGFLIKPRGEGDSTFSVFARATDAVMAACELQTALTAEPWPEGAPLRVRAAVHTGEADLGVDDYYGTAVNRCARLRSIAHGGQVLVSEAAAGLVREMLPEELSLRDLGFQRLRDLADPERVSQLLHPSLPTDFPALRTIDLVPNNLPYQVSTFVGREAEMTKIRELLRGTRLLTLTGAGGVGKTRLALQAAAEMLCEYPDGVWLVELAALTDGGLIHQALAAELGVREEPGTALAETLLGHLREKQVLIVLDNCEHLVEASAAFVESVTRRCSGVALLATSREALRAEGETVWRVPSLSVPHPQPGAGVQPRQLTQYAAVRLFIDRATKANPNFGVTGDNAPAVAEICSRLDGIPLAIELAAARMGTLSAQRLEERLDQRFRLLTGGRRTALPRQQTLEATVRWSYELLSEAERTLFARLSVFAGGFALEAAEAVCAADGIDTMDVADLAGELAAKSLIIPGRGRWWMLETLRAYGSQRLAEQGEGECVCRRHAEHFTAFAGVAKAGMRGPEQAEWLARVQADYANLRAALAWVLEKAPEAGARLATALPRFWEARGYWTEGREWLDRCLARGGDLGPELRADALLAAGRLACCQCDYDRAEALLGECRALCRGGDNQRGLADALTGLGNVAARRGNWDEARALYEESLALQTEMGSQSGIAGALNNLGLTAHARGEYDKARALYAEALTIRRELGDCFELVQTLNNLGDMACAQGDYATARGFHGEALRIRRELGDKPGMSSSLHTMGWAAHEQGDYDTAFILYEESLAIARELANRSGIAHTLNNLGNLARDKGDVGRARALLEESVAIHREFGRAPGLAMSLCNLGALLAAEGDHEAARPLCEESLALHRQSGDRRGLCWSLISLGAAELAQDRWDAARAAFAEGADVAQGIGDRLAAVVALEGLADVAVGLERLALAASVLASVEAIREALGAPLTPGGREGWDASLAALRAALGDEAFNAAWVAGRAMTLDAAVALARAKDDEAAATA